MAGSRASLSPSQVTTALSVVGQEPADSAVRGSAQTSCHRDNGAPEPCGAVPTSPEHTYFCFLLLFKTHENLCLFPRILLFFLQVKAYLAAKAVFQPLFDAFPSD